MTLHGVLGSFLAGVLLVNGVPHFIQGICGHRHMTPFKRDSSAVLNVLWGFANFIVGEAITSHLQRASVGTFRGRGLLE